MTAKQNSNSANEINTLKEIYAAINRNDISSLIKYFDSEIERVEPEGFATSGTYRGIPAITLLWSQARETWAEGTCQPEQFILSGEYIVAFVHVHVRLKNQTEWIDARIADVFKFKNGKVIFMRTFAEKVKALEWLAL